MQPLTIPFDQISIKDIAIVGGKNASLGEMYQNLTPKGIRIPPGFATTARAYKLFLEENKLNDPLEKVLRKLDTEKFDNLSEVGARARGLILKGKLSGSLSAAILDSYHQLSSNGNLPDVAVRSSATAEDLPGASFAGQLESFLHIEGEEELLKTCVKCFASIYTDRAIKYRFDHGFDQLDLAVSVGIQKMVRADKACAGVAFTIDPDSGHENVLVINGIWGLGENIVQGRVTPDEFIYFKHNLYTTHRALISKKLGAKQETMVYRKKPGKEGSVTENIKTPSEKRKLYVLSDKEGRQLAKWLVKIEKHYHKPMDVEWAKDGEDGEIYILQARPETVHTKRDPYAYEVYELKEAGKLLTTGIGLGSKITTGKARLLDAPSQISQLEEGEILVTSITNPDWDPVMKKAGGIVTDKGGRTSHAAIVARELGTVAIVGTNNATQTIKNGQEITVSCAEGKEGKVYEGKLPFKTHKIDLRKLKQPKTEVMMILGDPDRAFFYARFPNKGVGLMRLEFVINNTIKIHPMALVKFDELKDTKARKEIEKLTDGFSSKTEYFVEKLAEAVGTIAAAFYPHDVIVRMSDFKTNEYANLVGGKQFEPEEENPMLGFRGASRYYHELYREGFALECQAMKRVREDMGFTNVKLMIPFCRTVEEGLKVINLMAQYGLKRWENELELYMMIEIPSNVVLAHEFAKYFDGFSIGSNDLTQLTLGLDRDSTLISGLFDENNAAVRNMIASVIQTARQTRTKIGFCGQAPSDLPTFAGFLVKERINSISFNPDALIKGIENINKAEAMLSAKPDEHKVKHTV